MKAKIRWRQHRTQNNPNPLYLWLTKFDLRWHSLRGVLRFQVIRFHTHLVIIPILILREHMGAISTHSSSVILNGFRVLNTSDEIISFHLRKISIYRSDWENTRNLPRKKRLRNPGATDHSTDETESRGDEKGPCSPRLSFIQWGWRGDGTNGIVCLLSRRIDRDWKPNVRIIDIDRGWLSLLARFNMWFNSILKCVWIKLSRNEFVFSMRGYWEERYGWRAMKWSSICI